VGLVIGSSFTGDDVAGVDDGQPAVSVRGTEIQELLVQRCCRWLPPGGSAHDAVSSMMEAVEMAVKMAVEMASATALGVV